MARATAGACHPRLLLDVHATTVTVRPLDRGLRPVATTDPVVTTRREPGQPRATQRYARRLLRGILGVPVFVFHRNRRFRSCQPSVRYIFPNAIPGGRQDARTQLKDSENSIGFGRRSARPGRPMPGLEPHVGGLVAWPARAWPLVGRVLSSEGKAGSRRRPRQRAALHVASCADATHSTCLHVSSCLAVVADGCASSVRGWMRSI